MPCYQASSCRMSIGSGTKEMNNRVYRQTAEYCQPVGRVGRLMMLRAAALFLSSPEAGFITGHCLVADGGSTLQEQFNLAYRLNRPPT